MSKQLKHPLNRWIIDMAGDQRLLAVTQDEWDHLRELIDQYAYEYAERVIGDYGGNDLVLRSNIREQRRRNKELSSHKEEEREER